MQIYTWSDEEILPFLTLQTSSKLTITLTTSSILSFIPLSQLPSQSTHLCLLMLLRHFICDQSHQGRLQTLWNLHSMASFESIVHILSPISFQHLPLFKPFTPPLWPFTINHLTPANTFHPTQSPRNPPLRRPLQDVRAPQRHQHPRNHRWKTR